MEDCRACGGPLLPAVIGIDRGDEGSDRACGGLGHRHGRPRKTGCMWRRGHVHDGFMVFVWSVGLVAPCWAVAVLQQLKGEDLVLDRRCVKPKPWVQRHQRRIGHGALRAAEQVFRIPRRSCGHVLESEPLRADLLEVSGDSDFPSCVRDLQDFLC